MGLAISTVIAGDINVDLIEFENEDTMNDLATSLSYRCLSYITSPLIIYLSNLRDKIYQMPLMS